MKGAPRVNRYALGGGWGREGRGGEGVVVAWEVSDGGRTESHSFCMFTMGRTFK